MPIYEYSCEKCGKVFEEWTRRVDDNTEQVCPECNGAARRIVSNTSFVLKGGGWYVTEYGNRKSSAESEAGASSGAPAETGGAKDSSAAKSDSAAKNESAPSVAPAVKTPAAKSADSAAAAAG